MAFIGFYVNTLREVIFLSTYFTIYEHLKIIQHHMIHNNVQNICHNQHSNTVALTTIESLRDFYGTYCTVPVAGDMWCGLDN